MTRAMTIFQGLRAELELAELAQLRTAVRAHYDRLVQAQKRDELVAIDLAELLCERLEGLLATAHGLAADRHADVVGAARYFASDRDLIPDEKPCVGLDDDVEVFNHVARNLGRPELVITE